MFVMSLPLFIKLKKYPLRIQKSFKASAEITNLILTKNTRLIYLKRKKITIKKWFSLLRIATLKCNIYLLFVTLGCNMELEKQTEGLNTKVNSLVH